MKKLLALSRSDLRSTFRDPIFRGLLFFPFICFALVRWGFPPVFERFPNVEEYAPVILMWACLQSATMFGFIYGFLFLEEKEERIWQVIRVLPVTGLRLVFSRLLVGLAISTAVNFTLIRFGQIVHLPLHKELLLSFHFSLPAPLIALWLGALANNRIEGLAQMKIINLLLILPAIIYFLPYKATHIAAVIPTYWSYRSMETAGSNKEFFIFLSAGLVIYTGAILLLNRKLEKGMQG